LIIVAGWAQFDNPEDRDAALAAGVPFVEATRADEAGCLDYTWAADSADPGRILIYELWEDAATLDAHLVHQNYFDMRNVFAPYREAESYKVDVKKYRIDAVDPVYGPDRIASATFWSVE